MTVVEPVVGVEVEVAGTAGVGVVETVGAPTSMAAPVTNEHE